MATRNINQLPLKTMLEDNDTFVLGTPSGGRRIGKGDIEKHIRKTMGLQNEVAVSAKAGNWIKIAKFTRSNAPCVFLASIVSNYNYNPYPALFYVCSTGTHNALSFIVLLSPKKFYNSQSFSAARIVYKDNTMYFEVKAALDITGMNLFLEAMTNHYLPTPEIEVENDSTVTVVTEFDMTTESTTLNTQNMQVTENQAKMGGYNDLCHWRLRCFHTAERRAA